METEGKYLGIIQIYYLVLWTSSGVSLDIKRELTDHPVNTIYSCIAKLT